MITFTRSTLPVLYTSDVVVAGGTLAGVAAAIALARSGKSVTLVENRTYLGADITATLRPWIPVLPVGLEYPAILTECIRTSHTTPRAGEYPLHPDAIKICLEDLLLGAGINLLYASYPVDLCQGVNHLQGIVIGNKSGRQVLLCHAAIDATRTAILTRLSGASFAPQVKASDITGLTIEFEGVAYQGYENLVENDESIPIPEELKNILIRTIIHRGYRSEVHGYQHGHILLECYFRLQRFANSPPGLTNQYLQARIAAIQLASHLLWEDPHFRLAYLGSLSQELYGPCTTEMIGPIPAWAAAFKHHQLTQGIAVSRLATPTQGLWCLNEAGRGGLSREFQDPVLSCHLGEDLAHFIKFRWESAAAPLIQSWHIPAPTQGKLQVREPVSPQRGQLYNQAPVPAANIPTMAEVDVLVVGGGTSGAMAAIAAARAGARTLVLEMNPGLGGTATYGGVHHYWTGRHTGFSEQSKNWVNQIHDQLRYPHTFGLIGGWHIEAKAHALVLQAQSVGVKIINHAIIIATIIEQQPEGKHSSVRGVIAATLFGLQAFLGKVIIDATGDGDVAAFAGARFTYGSTRDHVVMWYSLPQYATTTHTNNNFTSMVDVTNILDYNRAILSGRRRGKAMGGEALHDHGSYLAPRESRHILGDVVQSLSDQLLRRCWSDTINIATSNNDIKGQISNDWMRTGLIPPNLEIEISYRMLLPRDLDNILVVGKSISAERDALSSIRMQADFENLGGAAGLAAAMAVRDGTNLREIDISRLQEELVAIGSLPGTILHRKLAPRQNNPENLSALLEVYLHDKRPLHSWSLMELNEVFQGKIPLPEICCSGPEVFILLEEALSQVEACSILSETCVTRLAQALALVGSRRGLPILVQALQEQFSGSHLPEQHATIMHANQYAPDQAAMPDAAYLLYSLGLVGDSRALPIWERVVELLSSVRSEDVCNQQKGVFAYVDALCFGIERLGDPAAIPILQRLHNNPTFRHQQLTKGFQVDYLKERQAYLELVIGRALARCGSPEGIIILINYLADVRALLAEHAHDELAAVSSQDFGKDQAAWSHWLETEGEDLKPVPWIAPADPLASWNEIILIEDKA